MPTITKRFNDSYFFAGQPERAELAAWVKHGYRSVVNLRPADEVERGFSISEERALCSELGLRYTHLPISLDDLNESHIRSCLDSLDGIERPVVVHCAGGARAAILIAVSHALKHNVSGENVLAMVESTGQSFNSELRAKVLALISSLKN